MTHHDQRFKAILQEFLEEFFWLFFPEWAAYFDFSKAQWIKQEQSPQPPEGPYGEVDIVVKLPSFDGRREWISILHTEVESADRATTLREKMPWYYINLRREFGLPVLPMALYLNVGMEGIGIDEYRDSYQPPPLDNQPSMELEVLRFRYLYVGLPALDALQYIESDNELAPAMCALMRCPEAQKAKLKADALLKIVRTSQNEERRFLLSECVHKYMPLEGEQARDYKALVDTPDYKEMRKMAITWAEAKEEYHLEKSRELREEIQKKDQTIQKKDQALRENAITIAELRFGELDETVRQNIEQWPEDRLAGLSKLILQVDSPDQIRCEAYS